MASILRKKVSKKFIISVHISILIKGTGESEKVYTSKVGAAWCMGHSKSLSKSDKEPKSKTLWELIYLLKEIMLFAEECPCTDVLNLFTRRLSKPTI